MRVVQVLRETGKADVNVKNKVRLFLLRLYFLCILDAHVALTCSFHQFGVTPLMKAAGAGHKAVVEWLASHNASIDVTNNVRDIGVAVVF